MKGNFKYHNFFKKKFTARTQPKHNESILVVGAQVHESISNMKVQIIKFIGQSMLAKVLIIPSLKADHFTIIPSLKADLGKEYACNKS